MSTANKPHFVDSLSRTNHIGSQGPIRQGCEVNLASRAPENFVIHVRFEDREDGGLRAYCDKVPNFFLSHNDPAKVHADVEPALEVILSEMYGLPMMVRRLPEVDEALERQPTLPNTLRRESYLGAIAAR